MPIKSKAQQGAMYAAAAGKSTIGIPKKVGKEFVKAEHPADKVEKYMEKPRQDVARIEAAIENGVWNPKESALCKFCAVKQCEYNRS